VGENKRHGTKASASSAKVIPLRSASSRGDLPAGYLEQVARRIRANLSDLVAAADRTVITSTWPRSFGSLRGS
jgi:hypothetical protein